MCEVHTIINKDIRKIKISKQLCENNIFFILVTKFLKLYKIENNKMKSISV